MVFTLNLFMHLQKEVVRRKITNEKKDNHQEQEYAKRGKTKFPHESWATLRAELSCVDVSKMS